jgi:hypothetical protein
VQREGGSWRVGAPDSVRIRRVNNTSHDSVAQLLGAAIMPLLTARASPGVGTEGNLAEGKVQ